MTKEYKVVFYSSDIGYDLTHPYLRRDIKLEDVVEAKSKSEALMQVAHDYPVYEFVSVERIK